MEKFFTPEEVAEALGVKSKTVMDWLRKGELPGIKAGRFWRIRESDFNAWLQQRLNKG